MLFGSCRGFCVTGGCCTGAATGGAGCAAAGCAGSGTTGFCFSVAQAASKAAKISGKSCLAMVLEFIVVCIAAPGSRVGLIAGGITFLTAKQQEKILSHTIIAFIF